MSTESLLAGSGGRRRWRGATHRGADLLDEALGADCILIVGGRRPDELFPDLDAFAGLHLSLEEDESLLEKGVGIVRPETQDSIKSLDGLVVMFTARQQHADLGERLRVLRM